MMPMQAYVLSIIMSSENKGRMKEPVKSITLRKFHTNHASIIYVAIFNITV